MDDTWGAISKIMTTRNLLKTLIQPVLNICVTISYTFMYFSKPFEN